MGGNQYDQPPNPIAVLMAAAEHSAEAAAQYRDRERSARADASANAQWAMWHETAASRYRETANQITLAAGLAVVTAADPVEADHLTEEHR